MVTIYNSWISLGFLFSLWAHEKTLGILVFVMFNIGCPTKGSDGDGWAPLAMLELFHPWGGHEGLHHMNLSSTRRMKTSDEEIFVELCYFKSEIWGWLGRMCKKFLQQTSKAAPYLTDSFSPRAVLSFMATLARLHQLTASVKKEPSTCHGQLVKPWTVLSFSLLFIWIRLDSKSLGFLFSRIF